MKRTLVTAGVAAVLAVGLAAPPTGAQVGATVAETGWWTRRPGAAALSPGGFEVAEAPDDDISVAALRVRTSGRLTRARLILTEGGGVRQADAALRVCVTASNWTPANPGAWAVRPQADCSGGGIELARDATRTSWSANVLPILPATAGTATLMIVPGTPPSGLPVDGFQVTFAAAAIDADMAPDDDDDDGTGTGTGGSPFGESGGSSSGSSFGFGFGGDVDSPAPFDFSGVGGGVTDTTGAEVTDSTAAGDETAAQPFGRPSTVAASPGAGQPWGRLPGLIVLAAIAGAVTAFVRRTARERGLLPTR